MTTKPRHRLTLKDRLSRLIFTQACKYLGDEGRLLISGTEELKNQLEILLGTKPEAATGKEELERGHLVSSRPKGIASK